MIGLTPDLHHPKTTQWLSPTIFILYDFILRIIGTNYWYFHFNEFTLQPPHLFPKLLFKDVKLMLALGWKERSHQLLLNLPRRPQLVSMILYLSIIYFYFIWNKELTITIKKKFIVTRTDNNEFLSRYKNYKNHNKMKLIFVTQ